MKLTVNRLCPALWAEITDLDVTRPMRDSLFVNIRRVLCEHDGVLVLRDQHLTPDQHIAFSPKTPTSAARRSKANSYQ